MFNPAQRDTEFRSRPYVLAILGTISIAALLVIGARYVLDRINLEADATTYLSAAEQWAAHFTNHMPNPQGLITTGVPTPDQIGGLTMSASFGHVERFYLFDMAGNLTLRSNGLPPEQPAAGLGAQVQDVLSTGEPQMAYIADHNADGQHIHLVQTVTPLRGPDGAVIGAVAIYQHEVDVPRDGITGSEMFSLAIPVISALVFLIPMLLVIHLSERSRIKDRVLERMSLRDPLTGVLNRGGLNAHTEDLFTRRRDPLEQIGVFFINLDNFKSFNDLHGNDAGDQYLCQLAERLLQIVGKAGFVGRMGGDEFVVIMPALTREHLRRNADLMLAAATDTIKLTNGKAIAGTASVGVHLAPLGEHQETALSRADLANCHAKENGGNQIVEYVPALDVANERSKYVESCLRRAEQDNLLFLEYQPFVDGHSGEVVGFEALLRLKGDDGKTIGPDEFIPVAERTGLIHSIGLWTLRIAMQTALTWTDDIYVSVNLSPVQFQRSDLADAIKIMIEQVGLPPARLELEMTESLLLTDEAGVSAKLADLQAYGVQIAMDDFGTGYSSLGYLWKYNFDKIKIDKSFLQGHAFDQKRYRDIIEMIVLLGHKLGMKVTVEGVETQSQTDILTQMSCDQFQGFYFARPMLASQTRALISHLNAAPADVTRKAG